MSPINIHTLPALGSGIEGSGSLRDEIEEALIGTAEPTVPGKRPEDRKWAFKRRVPTVVLYDEAGLRLYDRITSDAPEYYLFQDELNLLKTHGDQIARSMGFPGSNSPLRNDGGDNDYAPVKPWKPARWGDVDVGKWNNGVNGEEGLGGGWEKGWDVVELGAGALRKTAHLLTALSSALPTPPHDAAAMPSPITYHPLDLSRPELHRVLGEMDEAFGKDLEGKVDCIGLHGDYNAGLQFIRDGKLSALSTGANPRGRALGLDNIPTREQSISPESAMPVTPETHIKPLDAVLSPLSNPSDHSDGSEHLLVTPGPEISPLPSAMTDESSDMSRCGTESASGTWSPVEDEMDVVSPSPTLGTATTKTSDSESKSNNPNSESQSEFRGPSPPSTTKSEFDTSTGERRPLHLVFLGSSLGNFEREAAAPFLASLPLRQGDTLLLGLDGRPPPGPHGSKKVEVAYNDPAGHTRAFEEHGWDVVRQELGLQGDAGVEFVGRYNEELGRHEAYFRSKDHQKIHLPGSGREVTLEKDELLNIEWSYKYSLGEALKLFADADLRVINSWKAPTSDYRLYLLERPPVRFRVKDTETMSKSGDMVSPLDKVKTVPKWHEWQDLWKLWDHITLDMIPKEMLHQKPIDLRHICLFYLGHIPTFLDIHLTRMTKGQHTEPEHFKDIFERGIDPDVDDPSKIHSHSEVPTSESDWPTCAEVLEFRDRVRARVRGIYDDIEAGTTAFSRHVGRVLFMTFEHEAMHAETLLYMLIQSPLTRAPTSVATPQWDALARRWAQEKKDNKVLFISGGTIAMGHNDLEAEDDTFPGQHGWADHEFGWDNEHPATTHQVNAFKIDSLPVSNAEYLAFLEKSGVDTNDADKLPASWVRDDSGEWKIRTLYGSVDFNVGGDWPLQASKLELDAFANAKGGRLPTEGELRLLWDHPEGPRPAGESANIGVRNWHPVPPTHTITDHAGKAVHGHNGGVWEWTNSPFDGYGGFVPSVIYPGYSADFFDGKHYVVLGGSYATIPTIASRKSFRNWYQSNYRFSFVGGRVAYDV